MKKIRVNLYDPLQKLFTKQISVATEKEAPIEIGAVLIQYPMKNQN